MSFLIGRGRTGRETYPEPKGAGGGNITGIRFAFDTSTTEETYSFNNTPANVKRDDSNDLNAALTGFTAGNVLVVGATLSLFDSIGEGLTSISGQVWVTVIIDGVAFQFPTEMFLNNADIALTALITFVGAVQIPGPVTNVSAGMRIAMNEGSDPVDARANGALISISEVAANLVAQFPLATLDPVPP